MYRLKHRKYTVAKNTRQVEIIARITGSFEALCPNCGKMKAWVRVPMRHPRWRCCGCQRSYLIGLAFVREHPDKPPPFHALWLPDARATEVVNYLRVPPGGRPAIARVTGKVQWWCPQCSGHTRKPPAFVDARVTCESCGWEAFLVPLLESPKNGAHRTTPIDWIPPYEYSLGLLVQQRAAAAKAREGAREARRRRRAEAEARAAGSGDHRDPGGSGPSGGGTGGDRELHE